jgi:hypothetical protein
MKKIIKNLIIKNTKIQNIKYSKKHHFDNNIFKSPWKTWKDTEMKDVMKWLFQKKSKKNPTASEIPQVKPNINLIQNPKHKIQVNIIILKRPRGKNNF